MTQEHVSSVQKVFFLTVEATVFLYLAEEGCVMRETHRTSFNLILPSSEEKRFTAL